MIFALGFATLVAAWLLPGHYQPWTSVHQELVAAAGAAMIVLASLVGANTRRVPVPPAALGLLLLATIPLVQWPFGAVPFADDAVLSALYLCGAAAVVAAACALASSGTHAFLGTLFGAIAVAALASAFLSIAQWLGLTSIWIEQMPRGGRPYGNLTQPNHLATVLAFGAASLVWAHERRWIGGAVALVAWAPMAFALGLSGSRTGWLIVLLGALSILVGRERFGLRISRRAVLLGLALLVVSIVSHDWLAQHLLLPGAESLQDRLQPGARGSLWRVLWDAAWREPFGGYGWYQVSAAQQAAALDHPRSVAWTVHSHNLVLDLMIYVGAVPGLAIVAVVAVWYARQVAGCRDAEGWTLLAALTALLVHAQLEFPLHYAYFLLPAAVLTGCLEARRSGDGVLAVSRPVAAGALVAMMAMCAWIAIEYAEVEEATRRARLKDSGVVTPGFEPHVPDVVLLQGPRELLRLQLTPAREGMSAEELDWMRLVGGRYAQPGAMLRYAVAAGINGRPEDAQRNLALLCRIWPPRFCTDARARWSSYQQQFPRLATVAFPQLSP